MLVLATAGDLLDHVAWPEHADSLPWDEIDHSGHCLQFLGLLLRKLYLLFILGLQVLLYLTAARLQASRLPAEIVAVSGQSANEQSLRGREVRQLPPRAWLLRWAAGLRVRLRRGRGVAVELLSHGRLL